MVHSFFARLIKSMALLGGTAKALPIRKRPFQHPRRNLQTETLESRLAPAGVWTPLTHPDLSGIAGAGTMILLGNGTVMVQEFDGSRAPGQNPQNWELLTPDATGSYVNGTWSTLSPMSTERLYFGSNVLPNGNVFVIGGEYSGPALSQNLTNTAEIFNPNTDAWTPAATFPLPNFGDDPSQVLPNGQVLLGYPQGPQTYIYDPATNTYSGPFNKLNNDPSDEESWVKLADGSILSYDVFSSANGPPFHAQRFIPSLDQWVDAGAPPLSLSNAGVGFELGAGFLLPNNKVFFIGANNKSLLYDPATNLWSAGPTTPPGMGADDAPAAMLPTGDVLLLEDTSSPAVFTPPTQVFDYNYISNAVTTVATPAALTAQLAGPAFPDRTLVLPTGQMLLATGTNQLWVYTPTGSSPPGAKAVLNRVAENAPNTFTLSGTQLNGISEGAAYGDDVECASNFPIVRLTDVSGNTTYANSYNWSSTGVATGSTPETTQFSFRNAPAPGAYNLSVSAAGIISSQDVLFVQMGTNEDNLTLQMDPAKPGNVEVLANGSTVVASYPLGTFNFIFVNGDSNTDQLTVNYAFGNPIPVNGMTYFAGTQINNSLTLTGQPPSNPVNWYITGPNSGSLSGNITYANVQNLTGGLERDVFYFSTGYENGLITGGGGPNNTMNYASYKGGMVNINLQLSSASLTGGFVGIQNFVGNSDPNSSITAMNVSNFWNLTSGNAGSVNAVTFFSFPNLLGGTGQDVFHFNNGASVTGEIDGSAGMNWLDYSAFSRNVVVDLQSGLAPQLAGFRNINNVSGSAAGGDILLGNVFGGVLVGRGARNIITAGNGRSIIIGGYGRNTLTGGAADDLLINGTTVYDANFTALKNLYTTWNSALPYYSRIAVMQNGPNRLVVGATVFPFPTQNAGSGPRFGVGTFIYESALLGRGGSNWFITNDVASVGDRKPYEVVTTS